MSAREKEFLCVLPWNHIFIGNDGYYSPCCLSQNKLFRMKNKKGDPIRTGSLQADADSASSPERALIQNQMLTGDVPAPCGHCSKIENSGGRSYRQLVNGLFVDTYKQILEKNQSDNGIEFLDLRFGNQCNLKCRMCKPQSSAALNKEFEEFFGVKHEREFQLTEAFLDSILESHQNLKRINLAGGEPFIVPIVSYFLQRLVERDSAKNISLTYNSNIAILDMKQIAVWPSFKEVTIAASIDGYGQMNEYIRYPSSWDQTVKNLMFLQSKSAVYINCTVQVYNVLFLEPLFDFAENLGLEINLNILNEPAHLSVQALSADLKKMATSKLNLLQKKYPTRNGIETLIEFMNSKDESQHLETFKSWTIFLDQKRKQSWLQLAPEFKNVFRD